MISVSILMMYGSTFMYVLLSFSRDMLLMGEDHAQADCSKENVAGGNAQMRTEDYQHGTQISVTECITSLFIFC